MDIKAAFSDLSTEEFNKITDSPVWISLQAGYAHDGIVSKNEKAHAVKLAHLRTFTSPRSLREYYKIVDEKFEKTFEELNKTLPTDPHEREKFIHNKVKEAHALLIKLDKDVAIDLEKSLESFYQHVFRADKSFFQYFALPIISNELDKASGHYHMDEEDDK